MSKAVLSDDEITIRVRLDVLPAVVEGAWACGYLTPRFKVTDASAFAKELVRALNDEAEDGTTPIHRLFDKAIVAAIDSGAEGIEEHEIQDV